MSYRHTFVAALENLHEIEELLKGFPTNDKIPAIEIDLTLQKIRNLYELMLMMKKPFEVDDDSNVIPAKDQKVAAAVAPQKETAAATAPIPAATGSPAKAAAASSITTSKITREVQTLSDQYKGMTTLHDSLHHTFTKEGETLRHTKPVLDLMSAIGINDRFSFIRELFSNDLSVFENTIKNLNEATNFNDAYNFMIQNFDWDMDSESVQLLLEIIRRKFITGRHE